MNKSINISCSTLLVGMFINANANAVENDLSPHFYINGYLEGYYNHGHTSTNESASFVYNHNQTNRPQINLALIKASIDTAYYRARLGLASGTYMKANYAQEADAMQHIYEANAGIRLSDQHDLWLDVGVMPSHIGFESAVGMENWTLTRSMMADNSPYFETGAKVSYTTTDGKWYLSGLLVNGWQRIRRPDGNSTPAIGHQVTYRPNEKLTINSSSFIGNDKEDRERQIRYFHNLYMQMALNSQWDVMMAFDIGAEQRHDDKGRYNVWHASTAMMRYKLSDEMNMALRAEYFNDKHGVIISTDANRFRTQAYSVNLDYKLHSAVTLRGEIKHMSSHAPVFYKNNNQLTDHNFNFTTAVTIHF